MSTVPNLNKSAIRLALHVEYCITQSIISICLDYRPLIDERLIYILYTIMISKATTLRNDFLM